MQWTTPRREGKISVDMEMPKPQLAQEWPKRSLRTFPDTSSAAATASVLNSAEKIATTHQHKPVSFPTQCHPVRQSVDPRSHSRRPSTGIGSLSSHAASLNLEHRRLSFTHEPFYLRAQGRSTCRQPLWLIQILFEGGCGSSEVLLLRRGLAVRSALMVAQC